MEETTIYLGLGSNLGNRFGNLRAALLALPPGVHVDEESAVYETPPWGVGDQPDFLNQVLKAHTSLTPVSLLAYLKSLETQLGRQETYRYGPRIIDMDILMFGSEVVDTPELTIPHVHLHERAFVLVPLAGMAPDLRHPVLNKTMRELVEKVDTTSVRLYADQPQHPGE